VQHLGIKMGFLVWHGFLPDFSISPWAWMCHDIWPSLTNSKCVAFVL